VPIGQRIAASLVLTNVRVIATGQQLVQGAVNNGANATPPPSATTVTLEVSPGEAERCAVAARLGSLSLVVHSSETGPVTGQAADPAAAGNQPVWADQVSPALTNVHGPDVVSTVHVYSGSSDSQDFKF
jgi:Flp pilus assembly protein CpaB